MADTIFRSICGFCHSSCGLKIHVRNGKISRIEGDPDHPVNKGYLCSKAGAIKPLVESEERLKFPLKKTKGGFIRISWDEAFDFAADKLTKIREKYGPESLVHIYGAPVSYEARDGFLQFMGVYGSPNITGAGNLCHVPRQVALIHAFGGRPEPDYENTQFIVFWGVNPINTTRFSSYASYDGFNKIIPRAKERGVKIAVVDPIRSETASLADIWVQPNIGTDSALGLAMAHTIINEDLYDEEFVGQWVVGFDEIKKHVETMTPEWAEKITSIPAERIKEFSRLYAKAQGALIHDGNGLDMHTNGVDMVRVICMLIALTGNIDKPGGNVFFSIVPQNLLPTIKSGKRRMGFEEFPLFPHCSFPAIKNSLFNQSPDRPRAGIVHHSNPVLIQANQERTKRALQNLEFLMVFDIFPTATTEIADLILPSASDFERIDYRAYSSSRGGYLALREKVVEPVGESRSVFEVEYEMARRMGMEKGYPFQNTEEWINFALEPSHVTLDDLRNNHIVYASPPVVYKKYKNDGFKTPSRMVECYSERFKSCNYEPLPRFQYPKESHRTNPEWSKEYRFLGTTRKPAEFVHTRFRNLPSMNKAYPNPLIWVHPIDAEERGIKQKDFVEVKSLRGKIRVEAKITEDIVPGLVAIDFGWGNPSDKKSSVNVLTSDEVWDPISGGYPNRLFQCEIKKLFEEKGK
jgi:anaerobic selenocysteine-containing dehydrogenase